MPRDGTYIPDDPILDTLISARAKFTGPESWFRIGNEPINTDGRSVNCIGTALGTAYGTPVANFLLGLLDVKHTSLINWNNAPNSFFPNEHRTYQDVIDLLDRAIEKRRALTQELVA